MKFSLCFLLFSILISAQIDDDLNLNKVYKLKIAKLKSDGSINVKNRKTNMVLVYPGLEIDVFRYTTKVYNGNGFSYQNNFLYKKKDDDYAVGIIAPPTTKMSFGYDKFLLKQLKLYFKDSCPKLVDAIENKSFKPQGLEVYSAIQFYDLNCARR